ncbi:cytochrome c3 family protein [Pseudomonas aeruginosa]|uniref:cytochrome c3 family protein n=1 Tax=Pseudomonas aeruginosa TaxID=287 RepID=UPI000EB3BE18|nr:cytochrome c3 family protein [Pseudomonas aeruginosa]
MKYLTAGLFIGLIALSILLLIRGHDTLLANRQTLPLNFDHKMHGSTNCVECHHDYADRKLIVSAINQTCVGCHKQTATLAIHIRNDFHNFCQDCHLQRLQRYQPSGPVRACQQCHVARSSHPGL